MYLVYKQIYICVCVFIHIYACVCIYLDWAYAFARSLTFFSYLLATNDIVTINLDLESIGKCEPLLTAVRFQRCTCINF